MEPAEYGRTAAAEDRHFWFRELRAVRRDLLSRETARGDPESSGARGGASGTARFSSILDAGCGTGGNLREIEGAFSPRGGVPTGALTPAAGPRLVGLDLSPLALELARARVASPLVRGSILSIPFGDRAFDLVLCADVLYHENVEDDLAALREIRRVLRPGGILFVNVPAFDSLRSAHDRAMHTARRYSRSGLRKRLRSAGLIPASIVYWNGLLFPLAVLIRLLRRDRGTRSEIVTLPPALNALFLALAKIDAALAVRNLLPAGLSVAATARREDE